MDKKIIAGYLPYYLAQKGINTNRRFRCLNPDHSDTTPSMAYDRDRNKWHCFSCGTDADIFDLISWDYGTTDFSETLDLACEMFLGTGEVKYTPKIRKPQAAENNTVADITVRDRTYRAFKDLCPLTENDVKYLTEVRGISEKRAREWYFRTVPDNRDVIIRNLKKLTGYNQDILKYVPGFFIKDGKLDYSVDPGIGILIKDIDGNVSSVQIRRDTSEKGKRYFWFSSKYAIGKPGYDGGASPGSQKDIIIPDNPKKSVCITEGRFKAEILASFRNPVISVQGVSAWRGIEEILEKMECHTVYLMFDADMLGNYQVLENIGRMTEAIHEKFSEMKIVSGIWPIQYGKGIDDCILAGHSNMVKYVDTYALIRRCTKTYQETKRKNPKMQSSELRKILQEVNEAIFFGSPKAA